MTDRELLRRYATDGPDAHDAFAALVRIHAGWVYAVARRRVGDRALAEDVTQAAFIVLAQKGKRLPPGTPLAPWLFRVTTFAASRALRDESRRRRHEARAAAERCMATTANAPDEPGDAIRWDALAPVLDEAVESLASTDRRAVLLRFYQQLPLAEVGRSLGISEDAARKRVSRAVERLRRRLASLGVRAARATPAAALAAGLLEHATTQASAAAVAAHASRWAVVSTTADGGGAAGAAGAASTTSTELAKGAINMILWNHTKAAVAAVLTIAVVLVGVGAVVHAVVAQQSPPSRVVTVAADPARGEPAVHTHENQNLIVAVSPDRRQLAAFSKLTGEWRPIPQPPAGATAPVNEIDIDRIVASADIGTYQDARRVYAFSAVTGTWDTLTLPENSTTPEPIVAHGHGVAKVTLEKALYVFSAKTGKWTEPPFQEKE